MTRIGEKNTLVYSIKLLFYSLKFDGEIKLIHADSDNGQAQSQDQFKGKQQTQPSVYKAIVTLNSQILESDGQKLKLMAGMQVVAEINQGSRSVMRYLLSTVSKTIYESGHER